MDVGLEPVQDVVGEVIRSRLARLKWLPSATALAFILPILLLYWQLGGPAGLLADPSTGVHVRAGQWILAHHAIPRSDLFSFTLAGRSWRDWEWLSDIVFAVAHRLHGLSGVAALSLSILCVISVMIYRTARIHAGPVVAGVTCGLVLAATTIHWLARPHLFTWLALAIFCWVLERGPRSTRLWSLPAVMVLWVNLHPGFVAGFLVLGAWLAGSGVNWWFSNIPEERRHARRQVRWCGVGLLACGAATLVNPYFIGLHGHVVSYLFARSSVTAHVSEWLSPNFHNPRLAWFELLLPFAAAAGVWHGLKQRFHWCLLIFGFMHLALLSMRNVPLFAIVCAAPMAAAAEDVLEKCDSWRSVRRVEALLSRTNRRLATAGACTIGLALLLAVSASPLTLGQGAGIPRTAIAHLPAGRLFTTDQWADYLVYTQPGRKVFFDGRNDFYGPAFVNSYLAIMRAAPGWERILDKYHVSVALVPVDSALNSALNRDVAWVTRYRDSKATVFVRKPADPGAAVR